MKLSARQGALLGHCHQNVRCRSAPRRQLLCRAQQTTYQAPSYRTAATELDVLERYSVVVPDTGALKEIQQIDDPKAATVSSAVLTGILRNPAGQQELKARVANCSCSAMRCSRRLRASCLLSAQHWCTRSGV